MRVTITDNDGTIFAIHQFGGEEGLDGLIGRVEALAVHAMQDHPSGVAADDFLRDVATMARRERERQ